LDPPVSVFEQGWFNGGRASAPRAPFAIPRAAKIAIWAREREDTYDGADHAGLLRGSPLPSTPAEDGMDMAQLTPSFGRMRRRTRLE
jgi:hypothetical protein